MNKRRLLKLAKLLRKDAANRTGVKFDLGGWGILPDGEVKLDCGTTACAIGLAVISGLFKKEGFAYSNVGRIPVPTYQGHRAFDAISLFFDITLKESEYLFHAKDYPAARRKGAVGERAVATRIERFCSRKATA